MPNTAKAHGKRGIDGYPDMAVHSSKTSTSAPGYFELVKRFPLVPIKSEAHLKAAIAVIDELSIIDEERLTDEQADYLMVLTDLVEKYEDLHHFVDSSFRDGIEALRYLLAQANLTASDLGRLLGNRQLGAAILRRQRQLSKAHVVKLAKHFRVSTDLFLKERSARGRAA
jgi:HTH-type transcriptional regulator / antitoxin HigA